MVAKKPIEIDCLEVWRQISDYLDDEVDPVLRVSMTHILKIALIAAPFSTGRATS